MIGAWVEQRTRLFATGSIRTTSHFHHHPSQPLLVYIPACSELASPPCVAETAPSSYRADTWNGMVGWFKNLSRGLFAMRLRINLM